MKKYPENFLSFKLLKRNLEILYLKRLKQKKTFPMLAKIKLQLQVIILLNSNVPNVPTLLKFTKKTFLVLYDY